jgi:thiol:disulfide interchange protein DsbD
MGAAIGYGLTAPAAVTVAVFAALGLGMALPFLVLTFSPGLARRLPRPGAWMETLKQVLAFPLYATVAWLIFVTAQQVGPTGLFASLIGLVLVGFAAWCLRIASLGSRWGRRSGQIGAVAALLALAAVALVIDRDRGSASPGATAAAGEWEPFTQARLDALRAEGRPVFVNMTAAWCITCVVNEKTALSAGPVRDVFRTRNIAYLKGDWTNQNPEITRLLEQHGRSGVPLYLLYRGQAEAIVLPQILTQASMLETLARLGEPRRADLRIRTTTE